MENVHLILAIFMVLSSSVLRISNATHDFVGHIGGIVDCSTRVGREEKIAMEMAIDDLHNSTGYKLDLDIRDLSGNSGRSVFAAIDLIKTQQVHAIVGTLKWQDAAYVTEMDETTGRVPIISLATPAIIPSPTEEQVLPVIHMSHDITVHMRCIADIISAFRWQKVIAIYEDRYAYSSDSSIATLLSDSLRNMSVEIEHYSAFPALSSLLDPKSVIKEELQKLLGKQSTVFIVVQSSIKFTALLFEQAKQMGMMEKGHVWITTDGINSLLDSLNSSVIKSMEGVLGFKTFFFDDVPYNKKFKSRFRRKFQSDYPEEEEKPDPSIFALRAYDAVWTVGKAIWKLKGMGNSRTLHSSILSINFKGLSSNISFVKSKLAHVPTFQMINVVGKSYREMGFWSPKFGFSKNLVVHGSNDKGIHKNVTAEEVLGTVFWPGSKSSSPIGLREASFLNSVGKPLRVGIPEKSNFTGFSIGVFKAAAEKLPHQLAYEFVTLNVSFDKMVEMVNQKSLDAVIRDVEITADRGQLVEFSQPYVESGLVMVVPLKPDKSEEPLIFMKPFTKWMWFLMVALSLLTGFVVCVLEHRINDDFRGPWRQQLGTVLWFCLTALYLGPRDSLKSNLSRFVMAPWLFLILIVSSTYVASLTSMMTTARLEPAELDVRLLKQTNVAVGYDGSILTAMYLEIFLGFKPVNIKSFASLDDHAQALRNGVIKAAFFWTARAKVFIAENCKEFTVLGPTYKLGGFGFVFQKDSPLASDISKAIQRLTEGGDLQLLEKAMLSYMNCSTSAFRTDSKADNKSIGPAPFAGLFILSGGASAIALFIMVARFLRKYWHDIQLTFTRKDFWKQVAVLVLARDNTSSALQLSTSSIPQRDGNVPFS